MKMYHNREHLPKDQLPFTRFQALVISSVSCCAYCISEDQWLAAIFISWCLLLLLRLSSSNLELMTSLPAIDVITITISRMHMIVYCVRA